jgi:ribosome-binding protein aMBF1 (putative translation factor)
MSSAQFQKSLDLGVAQVGVVTMRATLMVDHKLLDIDLLDQAPALLAGDTEAGEFFARRNRDPAHAARMAAVTKKLGHALEATYGKRTGLLALRMKAGLSQTELARRMDTHQPGIARWERAPTTMSVQNIKAMAAALGVTSGEVFTAIDEQCEIVIKAAEHETA